MALYTVKTVDQLAAAAANSGTDKAVIGQSNELVRNAFSSLDLSATLAKATGSTTPRTLADWFAATQVDALAPVNAAAMYDAVAPDTQIPTLAKHITRSTHPGSHTGFLHSDFHIETRFVGSGTGDPASADVGLTLSTQKSNWTGTRSGLAYGEGVGISQVVRQSGPDSDGGANRSDASAWLANVANRGPCGFINAFEADVVNMNDAYVEQRAVHVYAGSIDAVTGGTTSYGFTANARVGTNDVGYLAQETGSAQWTSFFQGKLASGAIPFNVARSGAVSARTSLTLDTPSAGAQATFLFYDNGAFKWQFGKNTDHSFFFYNVAAAANILTFGAGATLALGFYGATPAAKPTGVAVDAAGIHAALVTLGLIAA